MLSSDCRPTKRSSPESTDQEEEEAGFHELKRRRRRCDDPGSPRENRGPDRVSQLPDHLLLTIIDLLDARTAVRAGALSRRWGRLPRSIAALHLGLDKISYCRGRRNADDFVVGPAPAVGEPPTIRRMMVTCFWEVNKKKLLERCICGAIKRRRLEELYVHGSRQYGLPVKCLAGAAVSSLKTLHLLFLRRVKLPADKLVGLTRLVLFDTAIECELVDNILNCRCCCKLKILCLSPRLGYDKSIRVDAPHSVLEELVFRCAIGRLELARLPKLKRLEFSWQRKPGTIGQLVLGDLSSLRFTNYIAFSKAMTVNHLLQRTPQVENLNLCIRKADIVSVHPSVILKKLKSVHIYIIYSCACNEVEVVSLILQAAPLLELLQFGSHRSTLGGVTRECMNVQVVHSHLRELLVFDIAQGLRNRCAELVEWVATRTKGLRRITLCHGGARRGCPFDFEVSDGGRYDLWRPIFDYTRYYWSVNEGPAVMMKRLKDAISPAVELQFI